MSLQHRVQCFRAEHGWHFALPTVRDAWLFLVTEVAEVGDCLIRLGYGETGYTRANDKEPDVAKELGDSAVMLCTLASLLGVDLEAAVEHSLEEIAKRR